MNDEVYDKYVAQLRALIENHGVTNAVHVMLKALVLELQDDGLFVKERIRMEMAAKKTKKLYYEIEKL